VSSTAETETAGGPAQNQGWEKEIEKAVNEGGVHIVFCLMGANSNGRPSFLTGSKQDGFRHVDARVGADAICFFGLLLSTHSNGVH
jgi:hypothetical protein